MKRMLFSLLVLTSVLITTMTTCKNPYVTELLKQPSELVSLEVTAYIGELPMAGGASFEPGFTPSVREYVVYTPMETDRFTVNANLGGNGTVKCLNISMDSETDPEILDFVFLEDEDTLEVVLTVEREFMAVGEYSVTVSRLGSVPPPKDIAVTITPLVGSYFLDRGVKPVLSVTAEKPEEESVLSYQWYRNEENNNSTGTPINGADGTSYALNGFELTTAGTAYYYVEVTNTFEGKRSSAVSLTRAVTFLNRERELSAQSRSMKSVSGFLMGEYPVTYEMFDFVRKCAELEDYKFANKGKRVSDIYGLAYTVIPESHPMPVTKISWRDTVVFCNAYSEMDGKQPVYLDSAGNILLDSRDDLENLIDESRMAGKNGYRLQTRAEFSSGMNDIFAPYRFTNGGEWLWDKSDEGRRSITSWNGTEISGSLDYADEFAYRIEYGIGSYILMSRIVCAP